MAQMTVKSTKNSGEKPKTDSSVVKSAARVLQIFEFFDNIKRSAKVSDVTRGLDIPMSSASVLLHSLVTLGYLHYNDEKRSYEPTGRVSLMGRWIEPTLFKGGDLIDLMRDLNRITCDTVMLAARNNSVIEYIHVVHATTTLQMHTTIGTRRPLATSAGGLMLLSTLRDTEVTKLIRRANADASANESPINIGDLHKQLNQIRRKGYLFRRSTISEGTTVLAMAVPTVETRTPLILELGGPTARMVSRRRMLIDTMRSKLEAKFGNSAPANLSLDLNSNFDWGLWR